MKKIIFALIILSISIILINSHIAFADNYGLDETAKKANLTTGGSNIDVIIVRVVGYVLSFVGVIFLIQIIFAGIKWMTAGGNTEVIKKAKEQIFNSIIGIIIIAGAYIIANTVFELISF